MSSPLVSTAVTATTDLGIGGLLGLYAFVALGSTIPILPTGAAVSAAAVLARSSHPWELLLVVAFGGAGAYTGDLAMYTMLRTAGPRLAQRLGWLRADDPDGALRRLRAQVERNEVRALLLSRLIPGGRIPVLLAAALGGYPLARFVTANIGAALIWATLYSAIGLAGDTFIPNPRIALVVVVVVSVLISLLLPRLKRRNAPSHEHD